MVTPVQSTLLNPLSTSYAAVVRGDPPSFIPPIWIPMVPSRSPTPSHETDNTAYSCSDPCSDTYPENDSPGSDNSESCPDLCADNGLDTSTDGSSSFLSDDMGYTPYELDDDRLGPADGREEDEREDPSADQTPPRVTTPVSRGLSPAPTVRRRQRKLWEGSCKGDMVFF